MSIPNLEKFYYWDQDYTRRNLHKVVRVNYDSYNLYLLNDYNEWEFDDNICAESLRCKLSNKDNVVLVSIEDAAIIMRDDLK